MHIYVFSAERSQHKGTVSMHYKIVTESIPYEPVHEISNNVAFSQV